MKETLVMVKYITVPFNKRLFLLFFSSAEEKPAEQNCSVCGQIGKPTKKQHYMLLEMSEWLGLPNSDQEVPDSNPAERPIQFMIVQRFIVQSLSLSPFHHLNMTL